MNKSILLSIKPQYVAQILNGEKTIEIRKHAIPVGTKVYIYATKLKNKNYGLINDNNKYSILHKIDKNILKKYPVLNKEAESFRLDGKVVASFVVEHCWELEYNKKRYFYIRRDYRLDSFQKYVVEKSCVNNNQMYDYGKEKPLFAWHISQLKIFDKPKELGEFYINKCKSQKYKKTYKNTDAASKSKCFVCSHATWIGLNCFCKGNKLITKAPQKYCYVEELK